MAIVFYTPEEYEEENSEMKQKQNVKNCQSDHGPLVEVANNEFVDQSEGANVTSFTILVSQFVKEILDVLRPLLGLYMEINYASNFSDGANARRVFSRRIRSRSSRQTNQRRHENQVIVPAGLASTSAACVSDIDTSHNGHQDDISFLNKN